MKTIGNGIGCPPRDLRGVKFGRLVAVTYYPRTKTSRGMWLCLCECGREVTVRPDALVAGVTRSCGCWNTEARRMAKGNGQTLGGKPTVTYSSWTHMRSRCANPRNAAYPNYGGRGIRVCEQWNKSFDAFLADMGECPPGLTIERIDRDGNYEPGNCRWATRAEQMRNTRRTRFLSLNGTHVCFVDLCSALGLRPSRVQHRFNRFGVLALL